MQLWKPLGCASIAMLAFPSIVSAASIDPATFSADINIGETITVDKTITLDAAGPAASKVDVLFLADNTGSMGTILDRIQTEATNLLNSISGGDARFTGIDVGFGVARYFGDPREPGVTPQSAYDVFQSITTDKASTESAIDNWIASGGGDFPEANFYALHQAATDGGLTDGVGLTDTPGGITSGDSVGWRDGAGRIAIWFGDASSHTTTVDLDEAVDALVANKVTVAAINTRGAGSGIDTGGQASAIAAATGGTLTNSVGTSGVVDAILNAVESATSTVDLAFAAIGDTSGLDVSYACTDALGCNDVGAGESRTFRMTVTGLTEGTYKYDTIALGIAGAVEKDTITVLGDSVASVPEPSTVLATVLALGGGGLLGKKRKNQAKKADKSA